MANKLGFSTGKGFMDKVDIAKKTDTTDLTNGEWKTCSLEANLTSGTKFYEGKSYQVHFSYAGATYEFDFTVPVVTTERVWVGYCKHGSTEIAVCLAGRATDVVQDIDGNVLSSRIAWYLDGSINSSYSLYDNVTDCKYRQLN